MSDNLDFMAIFGGEGSLDLGSGGEDFDALFAEKEPAPQPSEEKAPETTETAQPKEAPAEAPEPEEKKEDANAPEEKAPEASPQPAAAPEKKPAAPKAPAKLPAAPINLFEAAMRQVEEKITEDLFLNPPYLFEQLSVYKFCGKEFQRFRQVAVLGIRKLRGDGSREVPGLLRQVQDDEKSRTTQRVSSSRHAYSIIIFAETINNILISAIRTTDICIGIITIFPRKC